MSTATLDAVLARMMALHPKVIDLTLDRVWRLLQALGNPQDTLPPVIHIAGTNGKGSTLAMMRAGLEGVGLRVHTYTSPHLVRFHERIRLAGVLMDDTALTTLLDEVEAANGGAPITYFEITTCAALLAYARTPADVVLLEVGLGGRLDATNVIAQPALTVITPVSMDHEAFLGNTLAAIAGEKAGILKPGVPGVIGPQHPDALAVIEARAEALGAPVIIANRDFQAWAERDRMIFQDLRGLLDLPRPALLGPHQIDNAAVALAGLRALGHAEAACEAAVTQAIWPARMQRLTHGPLVQAAPHAEIWLDGGHNPGAGDAIAATLAGLPKRPTHAICGMLRTKDARGFMRPLRASLGRLYAVSIPGEAATLSAVETTAAAHDVGISACPADSVAAALKAIVAEDPDARVLICGSLYLAGRVLSENG